MFRSVMVPLDGSTFGEHALPYAIAIANRAEAHLHLLRVLPPIVSGYPDLYPFIEDGVLKERLWESQLAGGRSYLEEVVGRLEGRVTVPVTPVVAEGEIAPTICSRAEAVEADLIVLTTHGHGALARFWLGSVADQLVRTMSVPTLLVRPHETRPDFGREPALKRILLPLDGSPLAEQMIEPALTLGSLMGAEFTLVRVLRPILVPSSWPEGGPIEEVTRRMIDEIQTQEQRRRTAAEQYLEGMATRLRARSLKVQTRVVVEEQPAIGILQEAKEQGANLIALETHGRRGLSRLFLGSVADKVVRGGHLPVLLQHPSEP